MDLMTEKKKYIKPITESFPMIEEVFTTNSVEEHIGDGDDGGDIDPNNEDIDWQQFGVN